MRGSRPGTPSCLQRVGAFWIRTRLALAQGTAFLNRLGLVSRILVIVLAFVPVSLTLSTFYGPTDALFNILLGALWPFPFIPWLIQADHIWRRRKRTGSGDRP